MPLIQVDMFPGRSNEQKRTLAKELTDAFCRTCNSKPEAVNVIIRDVAPSDWAVNGTLYSEK